VASDDSVGAAPQSDAVSGAGADREAAVRDTSWAAALAGRYVLGRELGRGASATVYCAEDLRHGRQVALKVLHSELGAAIPLKRFRREIATSARLQHPYILAVHDLGESNGRIWFTMPFVEGESLRQRLAREGRLPVLEAARIAGDLAAALEYAHGRGVVHCDVKPENVLLSAAGHALLADFGIASAIDGMEVGVATEHLTPVPGTADHPALTLGYVMGTLMYMSPEQVTGECPLDGRSDVFALGGVLYEMVTGSPPFPGPTPRAVIARRFAGPPTPVNVLRPDAPAALASAVARALLRDPGDRFASAAEFRRALDAVRGA
jgi:eukaryotic-like serine/threonine-protein kinase